MNDFLVLRGLDGANPLAFLASLGVLSLSERLAQAPRLSWNHAADGWRPQLIGCGSDENAFTSALHSALAESSELPYSIDPRLPFERARFHAELEKQARSAPPASRHTLDQLAGIGTDGWTDEKGNFADTAFRMVRSGDSAGQGLPAYALAIRRSTDESAITRTLFQTWDYADESSTLRWDPIEDQRHALRWYDPSPQSNKKHTAGTMRAANALALEGLALMPVQPTARGARTTGISSLARRRDFFTWPIWEPALTLDVVRSLVALAEVQEPTPCRAKLGRMGIAEVYRSERIAPNKYYKNFDPAIPA